MDEKIKNLFLEVEKVHPFSTGEFFSFFGFSRHSNFKRFFEDPKFYKDLIFDGYDTINKRSATTIHFNRSFFLFLCEKKKISKEPYEKFYLEYKKQKIEIETNDFPTLKKDAFHNLNIYNRPAGKYYNHSLNTINLAEAILIDPFDAYKFCAVELKWQITPSGMNILNSYSRDSTTQIPFFHFDSKMYQERNEFLQLLRFFKEKYPLPALNLELLDFYYQSIKTMLDRQISIDHKKEFYASKRKRRESIIVDFKSPELKKLYREGAMMFHPDKNPEGLELFKTFNRLYNTGQMSSMKLMIKKYL